MSFQTNSGYALKLYKISNAKSCGAGNNRTDRGIVLEREAVVCQFKAFFQKIAKDEQWGNFLLATPFPVWYNGGNSGKVPLYFQTALSKNLF